jgi:hypothetical protein
MISKTERKEPPTTINVVIFVFQLFNSYILQQYTIGHEFSRLDTSAIGGMNACSIISFFMPFKLYNRFISNIELYH